MLIPVPACKVRPAIAPLPFCVKKPAPDRFSIAVSLVLKPTAMLPLVVMGLPLTVTPVPGVIPTLVTVPVPAELFTHLEVVLL